MINGVLAEAESLRRPNREILHKDISPGNRLDKDTTPGSGFRIQHQ